MNQQEKIKLIAEKVMGWEHYKDDLFWIKYKSGESLQKRNPYTSTEDFIEVVRGLGEDRRGELVYFVEKKFDECYEIRFKDFHDLETLLWLIDNKPKVMDCLVEIIEQESKGGE